jgi:hypothetical protein
VGFGEGRSPYLKLILPLFGPEVDNVKRSALPLFEAVVPGERREIGAGRARFP